MKLTKRSVEAIESADKDVLVWDGELAGFGVRVKPSGVRSYVVQYRNSQGRSRRYTIGRHGIFTADQARKEAVQLLADVRRGTDPAAERDAARKAPTVNELCDRYFEEHVAVHNRPRTAHEIRRLLDKHIRPSLGKLKAASVTRHDVIKFHQALDATPRLANHVVAVLSKLFSLAELWGIRADGSNPCRLVKRFPENKRGRFLSEAELGRLGKALEESERNSSEMPAVVAAIRLLALTGCRLSEVVNMQWKHIDFDAGFLLLPETKVGDRVQLLGSEALRLLKSTRCDDGSPFVLHGRDPSRPLRGNTVQQAWRRIRIRAAIQDARLHDLRHTVGTYAGHANANAFLVRDIMGHKSLAMTDRYVARDNKVLRSLSNRVQSRISQAMDDNVKS